jgi:hypothetical protein
MLPVALAQPHLFLVAVTSDLQPLNLSCIAHARLVLCFQFMSL